MASFRGLYDKLVSFIFDTSKDDAYSPVSSDYVAVYDSDGPRNTPDNGTWMPKKYVPVTTIGSGGGGGGSMSSFDVTGQGGVSLSTDGTTYSSGPLEITNEVNLRIDFTSVPAGLVWRDEWDNSTTYDTNDVVYNDNGGVYTTWFYINPTSTSGNALPTPPATSNTYWAQLGTQGPPGIQGPANSTATTGFRTSNVSTSLTPGDVGKFILMNNTASATFNIPLNFSTDPTTGIPLNSQVTVMSINTGTVQITNDSGVTVSSADGARYLRTSYSSATFIRSATNNWYLFGDLTNIA
jgi:hypothetical protein